MTKEALELEQRQAEELKQKNYKKIQKKVKEADGIKKKEFEDKVIKDQEKRNAAAKRFRDEERASEWNLRAEHNKLKEKTRLQ